MKKFAKNHLTKVIGVATTAVATVAITDPALIAATLGPKGVSWAMLLSGIATALRGVQNSSNQPPTQ